MHPGFHIDSRNSVGNLYVTLQGEFNGMCAWRLFKILRQHDGTNRVFVNTNDIDLVTEEGVALFKSHMSLRRLPKDWLYFKGRKGFTIAPNGSRVLVCNQRGLPAADRPGQAKRSIRLGHCRPRTPTTT